MSCATWQRFIQQFRNTWYCGSLSHPHPSKERRSAKVRKENLRNLKNSKKIPESRKIPTNLNESQKQTQNSENPKTSFFLILESVKSQIRFFSLGSTELLKFSVSPLVFPHTIFLRGFCYSYYSKFFCYKMFRKFLLPRGSTSRRFWTSDRDPTSRSRSVHVLSWRHPSF